MGIFKSLRKDNKGASLIAVVITMVFVVSIGVIIMNITLSNISMKEMELSSKSNFYSAEDVLETIKSSLTDNSAECLETAYVTILGKYADSIKTDNGVQSSFQASYLDFLISKYETTYSGKTTQWIVGSDPTFEKSKTHAGGEFAMGYYNKDVLTDNLSGSLKTAADLALGEMDAGKAQFEADYSAGTFTLKNIHIVYTDSRGYTTSIATDLIMTTPVLNFDGTNTVEEFMKYSIIADKQIALTGSPLVKGNAYAGCDGIESRTGSGATFTGNTVVTRGTIDVKNGSTLTIGDAPSGSKVTNLWAENVRTSGGETASTINLIGNLYISDDLSLDGVNSTANLWGNYYGYNFQKIYTSDYVANVLNNQPVHYERDADFSSSMIINGRNSKINMVGLDQLLLAGHTFISKVNNDNTDILMGESVSVRTNQIEYNVPDVYLIVSTNTAVSPNRVDVRFRTSDERNDGIAGDVAYSQELFGGTGIGAGGLPKIYEYVDQATITNPSAPFNTYYYQDGTDRVPRFYLKFKNVQAANDFFAERAAITATADGSSITPNLRKFLGDNDAIKIKLDGTTIITLAGSLLTVSPTQTQVVPTTLNSDLWEVPAVSGDALGAHAQFANYTAQVYKSLQLDLTTTNRTVDAETVRFPDNGFNINDKTVDPLFYNLIDRDVMNTFLSRYPDRKYDNGQTGNTPETAKVIVVDNDAEITPDFKYGIIIATGDVNLNLGFTGMIMSGGTVKISAGTYSSDELLVSGLFEDDAALGLEATFTTIFPTYNNLSSDVLGVVKVEDYIGYDNWTKYAE